MAERMPIPIGRRQGEAKSKFISAQRFCNLMLEQDPETGEFATYRAPGLAAFVDAPGFRCRGLHNFNGVLLALIGTTLYTVTRTGVATSVGSVPGSDYVSIADNGAEAVTVSENLGYVWDGSSLDPITDTDFQPASSVDFADQYLLFSKTDTGAFFLSDLADATAYDALDIASAESRPDNILRVLVQNREALLMGVKTIEGWEDVGDADFPFVRAATFCEVGLIGRDAACIIDNSVAWMANDKTVRILRGGNPEIISDPMIAATIETWADASVSRFFSFTVRGHEILTVWNPDGCLVWDAALPRALAWSSRESYGMETWRVSSAVTMEEWGGVIVLADDTTGALYTLDANTFDEAGETLVWSLTSRTLGPGGQPFKVRRMEIEIEPGVSLVSGQGSDAIVWLEISRDSGYTFGARLERSLGAIGNRKRRISWRNLGKFRPHGGVLRLSGSDPVSAVLARGWADIEGMAA